MHLADEATPQDLLLKGSPSGKNYIGPPGPAGGERTAKSFPLAAASWSRGSSTRMQLTATATWSMPAVCDEPSPARDAPL
jgi:hypothetical protein